MEKIKILAIVREGSGSDYHRVIYPFNKINGQIIDDKEVIIDFKIYNKELLSEVENYDILIYHWNVEWTLQELGTLQAKGVKIIYSIDDFWEFSLLHPQYQNNYVRAYTANRVKQHILNADVVITTTERLALHCMKYTDNIAILPNFLNPEDFKIEKNNSDKLRIGFVNSISHYPDMLMFKQVLNRLTKNKKITEKCEFIICGYVKGDKYWEEIIGMFKKKKNISLRLVDALDVNNYINLYKEIDVCFCPLEYTEFNLTKSALKILECSLTDTIPMGSSLYSSKELVGLVVAETPLQYEESVLKLLDKEYYNNVLKYIKEVNLNKNDWNKRIEDTKSVIGSVYFEDLSTKLDNIKLYGITYKNEQITEYNNILNQNTTTGWRFEYNPIINKLQEIKESKEDYIGFLSWRFPEKTGFTKQILYKSLKYKEFEKYDFINLTRNHWRNTNNYLKFSYEEHQKLEELLKKVLNNLGKDVVSFNKEHKNYTYSNFFLMKRENWIDYIENWIIPSIEYMENEIWEEVNTDANYKSGISSEELEKNTGMKFYNNMTFILERLVVFYMENKNLNILNIF